MTDVLHPTTDPAAGPPPPPGSPTQPGPPPPPGPPSPNGPESEAEAQPSFILYLDGPVYGETLERLAFWVHNLLIPVYGREVTSNAPWCAQWWKHPEALAQLHGLSMAWQELTGPKSPLTGPATWHRDYLGPVMASLRDPAGPFAGCKATAHRDKQPPPITPLAP
ncbi:DUF4913 domain-containing protein [Jidongwangia harbinensis]|uniref:DUF4913 domain-containing protein n=1 Tax=Jidongwangia harbinensis TaxID=2878561 RepID=UPI001CD9D0B2|nr:DUF4913 domain-containing protein [Jidongwangia harbinensis]MCA2211845.1 DUF4913 domain-containing protein [Jidongwangia harbinensis]